MTCSTPQEQQQILEKLRDLERRIETIEQSLQRVTAIIARITILPDIHQHPPLLSDLRRSAWFNIESFREQQCVTVQRDEEDEKEYDLETDLPALEEFEEVD